jgi:glucosylglycerate hydrolase
MGVTAGPEATGPQATLRDQAAAVLHANEQGTWTKAAPRLYPHQWSWDSAFIAIGARDIYPRGLRAFVDGLLAQATSTPPQ